MITLYKRGKYIKCVKGEFTPLEWILILKALNRFIRDKASHVDDVRMAKRIVNMEEKFVIESDAKQEQFINKPCVSEQACHEDKMKVLAKIRAEIDRQEKWLLQAGYTAYNIDIAFDAIKSVVAESEEAE